MGLFQPSFVAQKGRQLCHILLEDPGAERGPSPVFTQQEIRRVLIHKPHLATDQAIGERGRHRVGRSKPTVQPWSQIATYLSSALGRPNSNLASIAKSDLRSPSPSPSGYANSSSNRLRGPSSSGRGNCLSAHQVADCISSSIRDRWVGTGSNWKRSTRVGIGLDKGHHRDP